MDRISLEIKISPESRNEVMEVLAKQLSKVGGCLNFEMWTHDCDVMHFGHAIKVLKEGKKVARTGWNGKGMYLFFIGTDTGVRGTGGWTYTNGVNDNMGLLPFIAMKTADNKVVPWLASQTDVLANDWQTVE